MGHPYKASKAWHYSVELAEDISRLATYFAQQGERALAERLQVASTGVQYWLETSHQHDDLLARSDCYQRARDHLSQLRSDLAMSKSLRYIDDALHQHLVQQAIKIHGLLGDIIRATP